MIIPHQKLMNLMPHGGAHVGPASIDLRLSRWFAQQDADQGVLTMDALHKHTYWNSQFHVLTPGEFLLACTHEYIHVPEDMAAFVCGRSSLARMGLMVESAGFCDPGFRGQVTLEIYNQSPNPIRLEAGRRICQVVYIQLSEKTDAPYDGKYQNQSGPVQSRILADDRNR
jgi:dCTP deaminase